MREEITVGSFKAKLNKKRYDVHILNEVFISIDKLNVMLPSSIYIRYIPFIRLPDLIELINECKKELEK